METISQKYAKRLAALGVTATFVDEVSASGLALTELVRQGGGFANAFDGVRIGKVLEAMEAHEHHLGVPVDWRRLGIPKIRALAGI